MRQGKPLHRGRPSAHRFVVGLILLVGVGLFSAFGYSLQHKTDPSNIGPSENPDNATSQTVGCSGNPKKCLASSGGGRRIMESEGTVTTYSATSLTIATENGTESFTITDNTTERSSPGEQTTYSLTDIHTGQIVTVVTSGAAPNQAVAILLFSQSSATK